MWKPSEVVPASRNRAVCIYLILIVGIISYTSYLVWAAVTKSENPGTSFVLSNDAYRYPDIYVCLYEFYGCDAREDEDDCVYSSTTTQGGDTVASFNSGGDNETRIEGNATLTESKGFCVTFETSTLESGIGEERNPEDYIQLDMYWYPGGRDNASTTCIDGDDWEAHSESVFIFLKDSEANVLSAGIQVPYSCLTSESNSHVYNFMGIGRTEENKLDRQKSSATYKAISTSSMTYKDKKNQTIVNPYAWLSMEVAQLTDSYEIITEIDPWDIAELFGNVGGFWDLLLLLWPVFFVAAYNKDPSQKARSFTSPVGNGRRRALTTTRGVGLPEPGTRAAAGAGSVLRRADGRGGIRNTAVNDCFGRPTVKSLPSRRTTPASRSTVGSGMLEDQDSDGGDGEGGEQGFAGSGGDRRRAVSSGTSGSRSPCSSDRGGDFGPRESGGEARPRLEPERNGGASRRHQTTASVGLADSARSSASLPSSPRRNGGEVLSPLRRDPRRAAAMTLPPTASGIEDQWVEGEREEDGWEEEKEEVEIGYDRNSLERV